MASKAANPTGLLPMGGARQAPNPMGEAVAPRYEDGRNHPIHGVRMVRILLVPRLGSPS